MKACSFATWDPAMVLTSTGVRSEKHRFSRAVVCKSAPAGWSCALKLRPLKRVALLPTYHSIRLDLTFPECYRCRLGRRSSQPFRFQRLADNAGEYRKLGK